MLSWRFHWAASPTLRNEFSGKQLWSRWCMSLLQFLAKQLNQVSATNIGSQIRHLCRSWEALSLTRCISRASRFAYGPQEWHHQSHNCPSTLHPWGSRSKTMWKFGPWMTCRTSRPAVTPKLKQRPTLRTGRSLSLEKLLKNEVASSPTQLSNHHKRHLPHQKHLQHQCQHLEHQHNNDQFPVDHHHHPRCADHLILTNYSRIHNTNKLINYDANLIQCNHNMMNNHNHVPINNPNMIHPQHNYNLIQHIHTMRNHYQ